MKPTIRALFILVYLAVLCDASAQGVVETTIQGTTEFNRIQGVLKSTQYPIVSKLLIEKLGKSRLRRMGYSLPLKIDGKRYYAIDYALSDNESDVGFFLIEFITETPPKGNGSDSVVAAKYYFQAAWGVRFVPEEKNPLPQKTNSSPTSNTTESTPPSVAPSP